MGKRHTILIGGLAIIAVTAATVSVRTATFELRILPTAATAAGRGAALRH